MADLPWTPSPMSDPKSLKPPVLHPPGAATSPPGNAGPQSSPWIPHTPPAQQQLFWIVPCAVTLLTLVAFFPTLRNGFVDWDDTTLVLENPHYRGLGWSQLR